MSPLGIALGVPWFDTPAPVGVTYDPDFTAFNAVAGLTDPTQISALNDFYLGLKTDDLYDKLWEFWSIVGGTAASHAVRGMNPSSSGITWVGSPTHNASGVKGNGSSAYGNLNWNPVTEGADSSNFGLAVYRSGVESGAGSAYSMGITGTAIGYLFTGGKDGGLLASNNEITPPTTPSPNKDSGFHIVYLTNSRSAKYRRNKTLLGATTQTGSFNNLSLFGLCINASGSPAAYANVGVHKFFGITKGLTNTEADLLADRIVTLQTALGRA